MKGYETAFDICDKLSTDEIIKENNILIYPGGWKADFFNIIIKDFEEYDDNVKYACQKVKKSIEDYEGWTFIKEAYDEKTNQIEIHSKHM
ncbi:MAG: hypothetical protein J6S29_03455 [Methanosphaera sp.]|nr:hypothetical protein [Methanosphaera sp.]